MEGVKRTRRAAEEHAQPHGAYPTLVNGRTFLEMRHELARTLFLEPDYRAWVLARLQVEADREIERVRERYRRRLPHAEPQTLDSAILASEEGRAIRREASRPSVASLERLLAAWLGDRSAHDLFAAWEARHVERLASSHAEQGFPERWSALRRVFRTPSYTRVLALLAPVRDPSRDAVGYWRIVLPRVSWFQPRMPGFQSHPEWSDLPLDLVPDWPFAYLALQHALLRDDALATELRAGSWRADAPRYELTGRRRDHTPVRAYGSARVTLGLWRDDRPGLGIELTADVGLDPQGGAVEPAFSWRAVGETE